MTRDRNRQFAKLEYFDPAPILVKLRETEIEVARSDLPPKVKALRTHELERSKELRSAALFCHGMTQWLGVTVGFANHVAQDYDFVARCTIEDAPRYIPVQLKDVVSEQINPASSVQGQIDKLQKYVAGSDLTVAIHVSRGVRFDPAQLVIPQLTIGELWVFGAVTPDQSQWAIWGDFIGTPLAAVMGRRFDYPIE